MVVLPFLYFLAASDGIWRWWHHETLKFYVLVGVLLMISCLIGFFARGKVWLTRLAVLTVVGLVVGVVVGFFLYFKYLVYYNAYGDMQHYTNIAASQSPEQFSDGGMVLFSSDSHVDAGRAVGYRDAAGATTVCIAPISDGAMGATDPIGFWAVGHDCCEPRATFTCDGAGKGGAQAGVFLLDSDMLVSPSMQDIVEALGGHVAGDYDRALLLSEASFSTKVAEHVRFVRWTDDPVGIRDEWKDKGLRQYVWLIVAYFFLSVALGLLSLPAQTIKKDTENTAKAAAQQKLEQEEAEKRKAAEKTQKEREDRKRRLGGEP